MKRRKRLLEEHATDGTGSLALLDILSNGVGATIMLITIFGTALVKLANADRVPDPFTLMITADSFLPLAAILRTLDGDEALALTELAEDRRDARAIPFAPTTPTYAINSRVEENTRVVIMQIRLPDIEHGCLAFYSPVFRDGMSNTKATIHNAAGSQREAPVGHLRPSDRGWLGIAPDGKDFRFEDCRLSGPA